MCKYVEGNRIELDSKSSHWNALTTMTGGAVLDSLCQELATFVYLKAQLIL